MNSISFIFSLYSHEVLFPKARWQQRISGKLGTDTVWIWIMKRGVSDLLLKRGRWTASQGVVASAVTALLVAVCWIHSVEFSQTIPRPISSWHPPCLLHTIERGTEHVRKQPLTSSWKMTVTEVMAKQLMFSRCNNKCRERTRWNNHQVLFLWEKWRHRSSYPSW